MTSRAKDSALENRAVDPTATESTPASGLVDHHPPPLATKPSRRDFLNRATQAAAYAAPVMAALGGSRASARQPAFERVRTSMRQSKDLVAKTRRMATELVTESRQKLKPAFSELNTEIRLLGRILD